MSAINFHTKEISVKIVYYGPGLCGKTTSLQAVYNALPEERKPEMVSLATEVDRTIFFDFVPLTAYKIRDFNVRLQLYTVPGQVFYNATRKLVLNGVDGLIFVSDSQTAMRDSNLESLQNLEENLEELGMESDQVPMVISCNKRDLDNIDSIEDMDRLYNVRRLPLFGTIATSGEGVFDALKAVSQMVVNNLVRKGLGGQLEGGRAQRSGQTPTQVVPPPAATPPPLKTSAPPSASVAESLSAAAQNAPVSPPQPPTPPPAVPPQAAPPPLNATPEPGAAGWPELWPNAEAADAGRVVEAALAAGRWTAVVNATDGIVRNAAAQWHQAGGSVAADPIMTFILLRGISGKRYRNFQKALETVRAGGQVDQRQAMNAMILALEALW